MSQKVRNHSTQKCKGACPVCCKHMESKSAQRKPSESVIETGLVNPEGGLSSKGIQLLESIAGMSKPQLKRNLTDTKRDMFARLFEELGIAYPITSRYTIKNPNLDQLRKRVEERTRSTFMALEIQEHLRVLKDTYPEFVDILINPTEKVSGEIQLNFQNSRELKYLIHVSVRVKIPFDYPSIAPTLSLAKAKRKPNQKGKIDIMHEILYQKLHNETAADWLETAQEKANSLAKQGEHSLLEIAQYFCEKIEDMEEKSVQYDTRVELLTKKKEEEEARKALETVDRTNSSGNDQSGDLPSNSSEDQSSPTFYDPKFLKGLSLQESSGENPASGDNAVANQIVGTLKKAKVHGFMAAGSNFPQEHIEERGPNVAMQSKKKSSSASRYECEFTEIHILGRGAFGKVFKAQNVVDQNMYAIKRMVVNYKAAKNASKILLEAKVLSGLNHPHIVRYYGAWTEDIPSHELAGIRLEDAESEESGEEEVSDFDAGSRKISDAIMEEDSNSQKLSNPTENPPGIKIEKYVQIKDIQAEGKKAVKSGPKKRKDSDSWSSDFGDCEDGKSPAAKQEKKASASGSSSGRKRSASSSSSSSSSSSDSSSSSSGSGSSSKSATPKPVETAEQDAAQMTQSKRSLELKHTPSRQHVMFFDDRGNFSTDLQDMALLLSQDKHLSRQLRNSLTQQLQSRNLGVI